MTAQEINNILLDWCRGIGPSSIAVEKIEEQRLQFQGKNVLEGNEGDLDTLISLHLSPPKLRYGKEISEQFHGYVLEWIETWVLLSPEKTVNRIVQRAKESPSSWLPLLDMAGHLAQSEGKIWAIAIFSFARDSGRFSSEIESEYSRALAEIRKHENGEWHDSGKEWDRQLRSGACSYNDDRRN